MRLYRIGLRASKVDTERRAAAARTQCRCIAVPWAGVVTEPAGRFRGALRRRSRSYTNFPGHGLQAGRLVGQAAGTARHLEIAKTRVSRVTGSTSRNSAPRTPGEREGPGGSLCFLIKLRPRRKIDHSHTQLSVATTGGKRSESTSAARRAFVAGQHQHRRCR